MLKRFAGPRGRVEMTELDSHVLRANPLGDPACREVAVYLPAAYDAEPRRRFPLIVFLSGYTSSGLALIGWKSFTENLPERLDRLIETGRLGPCIALFPDCFTAYGGNQYVNSSAIGNYADYLHHELLPYVDRRYRTLAKREHRALVGKSSGGYGALINGMMHPELWGTIACHSGDLYFEYCYRPDFPVLLDVLERHGRSVETFVRDFHRLPKPSEDEVHALMLIGMAATYDADPTQTLGFHLPVDLESGELSEARWQRWRSWDPVELVAKHAAQLTSLRRLYFDCGTRDQYRLLYGARILHRRLNAAQVSHRYEEFDDNHSSVDYRLDVSLPELWPSIAAE